MNLRAATLMVEATRKHVPHLRFTMRFLALRSLYFVGLASTPLMWPSISPSSTFSTKNGKTFPRREKPKDDPGIRSSVRGVCISYTAIFVNEFTYNFRERNYYGGVKKTLQWISSPFPTMSIPKTKTRAEIDRWIDR